MLVVSEFWAVIICLFVACGGSVCFLIFWVFLLLLTLLSEHTFGLNI